jgi:hypothetical protein
MFSKYAGLRPRPSSGPKPMVTRPMSRGSGISTTNQSRITGARLEASVNAKVWERRNALFATALPFKGALSMSHPTLCKLAILATLLTPISALAQSGGGGGGGGSGGGSSGGASAGGAAGGTSSTSAGAAAPAGSAGAGASAVNGVTGPGNVGGLNNSGNDPSGAGNGARALNNTPGTNGAGTANSSGSTSGSSGGAPRGSTTVGLAGNPAGGATGGRIDGTVTQGPNMPGDDAIKAEDDQNSKVDKKINSICRGC